jgi:hypothetical protein
MPRWVFYASTKYYQSSIIHQSLGAMATNGVPSDIPPSYKVCVKRLVLIWPAVSFLPYKWPTASLQKTYMSRTEFAD